MTAMPMNPDLLKRLRERRDELRRELDRSRKDKEALDQRIASLEREYQLVDGLVNENGAVLPDSRAKAVTLADIDPAPRERGPASIRFPNGDTRRLGQWNKVLIEIAQYLKTNGKLVELTLPLKMPGASRLLLSKNKIHPNGRDFFLPLDLGDGIWLETHASARNLLSQARFLVTACGEDPRAYTLEP